MALKLRSISMKRFILSMVFFVFLSFSLSAYSFVFDSGSIGIEGDVYDFDLGVWGLRIKSPVYSFGSVDSGGDIALINNPHSLYSKGLYFSIPSKNSSLLASSVTYENWRFSILYGERNGVGVSVEGKDWRAFLYSFLKEKDEEMQKKIIERRDMDVFYLGFDGKRNMLSLSSYISLTDSLFVSSMVKGEIDLGMMKIGMGYGRIQSLFEESKDWETSLKMALYEKDAEVSFSLLLSAEPIYISSFRSLSFFSKGELNIGRVKIESETKRNFSKGKESLDASLSVYGDIWRIKISRNSGLTLSFHFDSSSFTLSKEKIETKVIIKRDDIKMTIESSGKSSVGGKIDYSD